MWIKTALLDIKPKKAQRSIWKITSLNSASMYYYSMDSGILKKSKAYRVPYQTYIIAGRGVLTLLFCEDPLYCLPPLLFKFCLPHLFFAVASNPHHTAHSVVFLFLWMPWLCHIWCTILLNNIMDVHMSSLSTLMRVLCNKASNFIVYIRVLTLFKNITSLFFVKPPPSWTYKLSKSPFFRKFAPIHWFSWTSHWKVDFLTTINTPICFHP